MKIAIAEIAQETDSFSPITADRSDFETYGLYFGEEILERMQGAGPIGGFLDILAEQHNPIELVPIVRAWGSAGGTITAETIEFLTEKLITGLKAAREIDALFLVLHGAAASEIDDDVEGHVLAAAREIIGNEIPIVVPFDHHANITQRMINHADILCGHETQPHDPRATGRKAARLLFDILNHKIKPTVAWQKIPMITPQDQFLTSQGPMKQWFDRARELEQQPGVLDVSPYPMQPWLDVAEGGWSIIVHTDNNLELAKQLTSEMANLAWNLRDQFWASERVAPNDAINQAIQPHEGLIILSDTGDSVYGGAPGDSTCILKALLARKELQENSNTPLILIPMIDLEAVDAAFNSGISSDIKIDLGGKQDNVFSQPVTVHGKVAALSEGVTVELIERGACHLGRTALIELGSLRIALLGHRSFAINHPILYTHLGIDIADAGSVVVKTASNFQFFAPWRTGMIRVDSPGMTQSNLTAFNWQHVPRPIYPLDELETWQPSPAIRV